jgi:hypothetical protein
MWFNVTSLDQLCPPSSGLLCSLGQEVARSSRPSAGPAQAFPAEHEPPQGISERRAVGPCLLSAYWRSGAGSNASAFLTLRCGRQRRPCLGVLGLLRAPQGCAPRRPSATSCSRTAHRRDTLAPLWAPQAALAVSAGAARTIARRMTATARHRDGALCGRCAAVGVSRPRGVAERCRRRGSHVAGGDAVTMHRPPGASLARLAYAYPSCRRSSA